MSAGTLVVTDRLGNAQTLAVEVNAGVATPHSVPEIGGVAASATNPIPVFGAAATYLAQSSLLITTSVGATSTQIASANAASRTLTIFSSPSSTANIWLNPSGVAAVVGQGALVAAGGGSFTFNPPPAGAVYAISESGSVTISAIGG